MSSENSLLKLFPVDETKFAKPYPYWQKIEPKSIPLLAQIHKNSALFGTTFYWLQIEAGR